MYAACFRRRSLDRPIDILPASHLPTHALPAPLSILPASTDLLLRTLFSRPFTPRLPRICLLTLSFRDPFLTPGGAVRHVCFNSVQNGWRAKQFEAQIRREGQQVTIGSFVTAEEGD